MSEWGRFLDRLRDRLGLASEYSVAELRSENRELARELVLLRRAIVSARSEFEHELSREVVADARTLAIDARTEARAVALESQARSVREAARFAFIQRELEAYRADAVRAVQATHESVERLADAIARIDDFTALVGSEANPRAVAARVDAVEAGVAAIAEEIESLRVCFERLEDRVTAQTLEAQLLARTDA